MVKVVVKVVELPGSVTSLLSATANIGRMNGARAAWARAAAQDQTLRSAGRVVFDISEGGDLRLGPSVTCTKQCKARVALELCVATGQRNYTVILCAQTPNPEEPTKVLSLVVQNVLLTYLSLGFIQRLPTPSHRAVGIHIRTGTGAENELGQLRENGHGVDASGVIEDWDKVCFKSYDDADPAAVVTVTRQTNHFWVTCAFTNCPEDPFIFWIHRPHARISDVDIREELRNRRVP